MIITLSTQKGGAGKTTIAIALANYLVSVKKKKVVVYDLDFQKSFYQKWRDDETLNLPILYEVIKVENDSIEDYDIQKISEMSESEDIYIFDLAGTLDQKYANILMLSDFLIIPFQYSDVSIHSTMIFIKFLGLAESESQKIFVRSMYDKGYDYLNQPKMDEIISTYGKMIDAPIYKRNILQTINTRRLNYDEKKAVKNTLDEIIEYINNNHSVKI